MPDDLTATPDREPPVLHHWSARKLPPVVLLYVGLVFVAFMALAFFGFHSLTGVKALATTALATLVSLVPGAIGRTEYRLTEAGLDRRPLNQQKPRAYQEVWRWDRLSHVTRSGQGFKFFRPLDEPNRWRRFWKLHVSDEYAGEFRVEVGEFDRVLAMLEERRVEVRD